MGRMKRLRLLLLVPSLCLVVARAAAQNAPIVPAISFAPTSPSSLYLTEVLQRAGYFFAEAKPGSLAAEGVLVLAGERKFTPAERNRLTAFVQDGGALVSIGALHGLEDLFGVETIATGLPKAFGSAQGKRQLGEGYLDVKAASHPVLSGLKSSLHFFGGVAVRATEAKAFGRVLDRCRRPTGLPVLLERRFGRGVALLITPDLLNSIVHIQQGIAVLRDGTPAFDGTMPVNDGVLKADDGQVLDHELDRTVPEEGAAPLFLYPVADELRLILLRGIQYAAQAVGQPLLQIAPWPRNLPAIGCISHDSDGNNPALAEAMLEEVRRAGIRTTWCQLFPCGYPPALFQAIRAAGCEIALHYDAMKKEPGYEWGFETLRTQLQGIRKESGINEILSNKNHYTRWQGRLEFFRWCETLGLKVDGTMGPSKQGGCGFPRGTCQPWRPLDDEVIPARFLDVYELPLITQDLEIHLPSRLAPRVLDQVVAHGGVAHFLFHPAHIRKPGIADALHSLVQEGRKRGMEWWTHAELWQWETARRSVRFLHAKEADGKWSVKLSVPRPVKEPTLILHDPKGEPRRITRDLPAAESLEVAF